MVVVVAVVVVVEVVVCELVCIDTSLYYRMLVETGLSAFLLFRPGNCPENTPTQIADYPDPRFSSNSKSGT